LVVPVLKIGHRNLFRERIERGRLYDVRQGDDAAWLAIGSGFSNTALTTLKTAVFAPIPTAMMPIQSRAKPGLRRSTRNA
jgi:hypothetical protein